MRTNLCYKYMKGVVREKCIMRDGQRDVYKELAGDDWFAYRRMERAANITVRHMYASWQRADDHDRHLERMALWGAILLDADCAEALQPGHELRLWPPDISAETRYGLQAGIRMVHAVLPFTTIERDTLNDRPMQSFAAQFPAVESDELASHEPELVERWHQWLWQDEFGRPQTSVEAIGAAAILMESCRQLFLSLDTILSDPLATPL